MKIELTEDQEKLLNYNGTVITASDGYEFKHLPFWFKQSKGDKRYEILSYKDLPLYVRDYISEETNVREELVSALGFKSHQYYVVSHNQNQDGMWDQISNGFDTYEEAEGYKDHNFCKKHYPNAFIVSTIK